MSATQIEMSMQDSNETGKAWKQLGDTQAYIVTNVEIFHFCK